MNTYNVLFDTRNHKRTCSTSFNVSAASEKDAEIMAIRLLRQCGENVLNFKAPKTRRITIEERLAMMG